MARIQDIPVEKLDEQTYVIYLEVPPSQVVLLQGLFELYEGLGTVRTLDIPRSLVCILTTPSFIEDCIDVLEAIEYTVKCRVVPRPKDIGLPGFFEQEKP